MDYEYNNMVSTALSCKTRVICEILLISHLRVIGPIHDLFNFKDIYLSGHLQGTKYVLDVLKHKIKINKKNNFEICKKNLTLKFCFPEKCSQF